MLLMRLNCVQCKRKTTQHWFFPTFKLPASTKRIMTDLLNIILGNLCI